MSLQLQRRIGIRVYDILTEVYNVSDQRLPRSVHGTQQSTATCSCLVSCGMHLQRCAKQHSVTAPRRAASEAKPPLPPPGSRSPSRSQSFNDTCCTTVSFCDMRIYPVLRKKPSSHPKWGVAANLAPLSHLPGPCPPSCKCPLDGSQPKRAMGRGARLMAGPIAIMAGRVSSQER